jgi:transposase-like protein
MERVTLRYSTAAGTQFARLKKENADLREANEILKKAMAFFAVKSPRQ